MNTEQLIANLVCDARPIRPLRRPWRRAAVWAAAGIAYLGVVIALMPLRSDLTLRLHEPRFIAEQAAALLTGLTAATAAFATSIPGYPRAALLWASLVGLAAWVGIVGFGVAQDISRLGASAPVVHADWRCVMTILLGSAVPAAAIAIMIRQGAAVTPRITAALAALAAAGLGNLGICVFHPHNSSLAVLVWHCGTVLILAAMAGLAGPQALRWPATRWPALRA
jgi:hypothetical protein